MYFDNGRCTFHLHYHLFLFVLFSWRCSCRVKLVSERQEEEHLNHVKYRSSVTSDAASSDTPASDNGEKSVKTNVSGTPKNGANSVTETGSGKTLQRADTDTTTSSQRKKKKSPNSETAPKRNSKRVTRNERVIMGSSRERGALDNVTTNVMTEVLTTTAGRDLLGQHPTADTRQTSTADTPRGKRNYARKRETHTWKPANWFEQLVSFSVCCVVCVGHIVLWVLHNQKTTTTTVTQCLCVCVSIQWPIWSSSMNTLRSLLVALFTCPAIGYPHYYQWIGSYSRLLGKRCVPSGSVSEWKLSRSQNLQNLSRQWFHYGRPWFSFVLRLHGYYFGKWLREWFECHYISYVSASVLTMVCWEAWACCELATTSKGEGGWKRRGEGRCEFYFVDWELFLLWSVDGFHLIFCFEKDRFRYVCCGESNNGCCILLLCCECAWS